MLSYICIERMVNMAAPYNDAVCSAVIHYMNDNLKCY